MIKKQTYADLKYNAKRKQKTVPFVTSDTLDMQLYAVASRCNFTNLVKTALRVELERQYLKTTKESPYEVGCNLCRKFHNSTLGFSLWMEWLSEKHPFEDLAAALRLWNQIKAEVGKYE